MVKRLMILWLKKGNVKYFDAKDQFYKFGIRVIKCKKWIVLMIPVLAVYNMTHLAFAAAHEHWQISSQFGEVGGVYTKPHNGIDFPVSENTSVLSVTDGKVIGTYDEGNISFGKSVHILDPEGREIIYGHLSKFDVHTGEFVHIGQEVAKSGNTGFSTGPHCHIQINVNGRPIDPMPTLIEADEKMRKMG